MGGNPPSQQCIKPSLVIKREADVKELFGEIRGFPSHEDQCLMETDAFEDSYVFLKDNQEINGLPFLSINGQMMPTLVPDDNFVQELYERIEF